MNDLPAATEIRQSTAPCGITEPCIKPKRAQQSLNALLMVLTSYGFPSALTVDFAPQPIFRREISRWLQQRLACCFITVHRFIGPTHRLIQRFGALHFRLTETHRESQGALDPLAQDGAQRLQLPFDLGSGAAQQQDEFIATQAADQIPWLSNVLKQVTQHLQTLIAYDMALLIIDGFEAVDVHDDQHRRGSALGPFPLLKGFPQAPAIEHRGQRIIVGQGRSSCCAVVELPAFCGHRAESRKQRCHRPKRAEQRNTS